MWYILVMILLVAVLWKYINYIQKKEAGKPKELKEEDIKVFHIFPDYPKSNPYECKAGEEFHFIVRGYTDKYQIEAVPINGDKVIWKHTEGNGRFKGARNLKTGIYSGTSIDYLTPETDVYTKEKMIFISAHYREFTDATWIKIIN